MMMVLCNILQAEGKFMHQHVAPLIAFFHHPYFIPLCKNEIFWVALASFKLHCCGVCQTAF